MQDDVRKSRITKKYCEDVLHQIRKSRRTVLIVALVFAAIVIVSTSVGGWDFAVLAIAVFSFAVLRALYDVIHISRSCIYIEVDTVVKIKKKYKSNGIQQLNKVHTFEFRNNGKFDVAVRVDKPLFSVGKSRLEEIDEAALEYFEAGEQFYVLAAKFKNKTKILKIFSLSSFRLISEEFEEQDGRYIITEQKEKTE